ncbi:hypothetical protein SEA_MIDNIGHTRAIN_43 [Arthrobacter phage MidnightRain]|nr:hypothetical protein SEA_MIDNIGHTRAIN_43 [Arthrobacter phage MidnightRain]
MDHALYIALKRFRTEMWRSFPLCVFVRWLFNRHPKTVVPVALAMGIIMITIMITIMIMDWQVAHG